MNISKELLSVVFNDIQKLHYVGEGIYRIVNCSGSICEYEIYKSVHDGSGIACRDINIYELAHKCKEWAYAEGYCIRTFQSAIGWVVDLIHEDRTKTQSQYSRKDNINGQLYIEIFPRETEATIHPKHFNIELDAIFKACQWILDKKDKK